MYTRAALLFGWDEEKVNSQRTEYLKAILPKAWTEAKELYRTPLNL